MKNPSNDNFVLNKEFTPERLSRFNLRCYICNSVSSEDISDEYGENFTKATMHEDPLDKTKIICADCIEAISDVTREFDEIDLEFVGSVDNE